MRVLITGITGQIGGYLAPLLLHEGHTVLGIGSPGSTRPLPSGALTPRGAWTSDGLEPLLFDSGPLDAIVHLGAPTHIPSTWDDPAATFDTIGHLGARMAYLLAKRAPATRLVHASTSNVFGVGKTDTLDESTPFAPVSPYGVAKAAAHLAVQNARDGFGLPASNLIYFQALSPHAAPTLVLSKITRGVAEILAGRARTVRLGTMSIVRDVSHALDFARAAVVALGATPGDYACCSGVGRSIREMAETVCRLARLDPANAIEEEVGYARPNDIPRLVGNPAKLVAEGWSPTITFEALAKECLVADVERARSAAG